MTKRKTTGNVTISLNLELLKATRAAATAENRTFSNYVETLLKKHVKTTENGK